MITGMRQTATCLEIDGQLDLSSPNGLQCFKLLKDGRIHEFSVGGDAHYGRQLIRRMAIVSADWRSLTCVRSACVWGCESRDAVGQYQER